MSLLIRMWHCLPTHSPSVPPDSSSSSIGQVSIQGDRPDRVSDCYVPTLHMLSHLVTHYISVRNAEYQILYLREGE